MMLSTSETFASIFILAEPLWESSTKAKRLCLSSLFIFQLSINNFRSNPFRSRYFPSPIFEYLSPSYNCAGLVGRSKSRVKLNLVTKVCGKLVSDFSFNVLLNLMLIKFLKFSVAIAT